MIYRIKVETFGSVTYNGCIYDSLLLMDTGYNIGNGSADVFVYIELVDTQEKQSRYGSKQDRERRSR